MTVDAPHTAEDWAAAWDSLTPADLEAAGSRKWTKHPGTLGMWLAEMDFGIAPRIQEVLEAAVGSGALGYLPPHERDRLADATARYQREHFGWDVAATDVLVLSDVLSTLAATLTHLTRPDAPVVVFTPAYMPFLTWPASLDRELVEVPCEPDAQGLYRLDLDGLAAALERTGPGALVVLCNPWNPVGRVLTREELTALADVVEAGGARVFSDEIHAPLVLDPDARHVPYASIDDRTARHTVTGVAASKGWNIPGLKCGQLVLSNDADREAMAPYTYRLGDSVGLLGARAAVVAYDECGPWTEAVVDYLRGNADLLRAAVDDGRLPGVTLSPLQGTYIAWLDLRGTRLHRELDEARRTRSHGQEAGTSAEPVADAVREASGVTLTEGAQCGAAGEGFVRMVIACPRPVLLEAIERLGRALG